MGNSYQRAIEIMQQRGITITKITAILIMGNGDRYEQDGINPFMEFWNVFPKRNTGRGGIWRWSHRAWEGGVQTKPKVLTVESVTETVIDPNIEGFLDSE